MLRRPACLQASKTYWGGEGLSHSCNFMLTMRYNISMKLQKMGGVMELDRLLEQNGGLITRADALDAGVPNGTFYNYVRENRLQKAAHGIYLAPGSHPDEMLLLQLRYPKAIFSHGTALYLHDLSEREPVPLAVTVPSSYNAGPLSRTGAEVHYVKGPWHGLGACEMETPEGNPVRAYDMERTVCDIVRRRSAMDVSSFNYAMQGYAKSRGKDLRRLGRYARAMGIDAQVRNAVEVLL